MGIASSFNKAGNKFTFQSDSTFEFFSLADLYNEDPEAVHVVRALWVNKDSKYGPSPVATLEDRYINLPGHALESVNAIIDSEEAVAAVNDGKFGFKVRTYEDTKYGRGTCYSVEWVDL